MRKNRSDKKARRGNSWGSSAKRNPKNVSFAWQYTNWSDRDDVLRYVNSYSSSMLGFRQRPYDESPNFYDSFASAVGDY